MCRGTAIFQQLWPPWWKSSASLTVQGGLQSGHRSLVSHMEHTGVLQGGALCSSQAAPHQGLRGPSRLVPLTLTLGPLCSGDGFFSSFT